jgi:hypothetical protein
MLQKGWMLHVGSIQWMLLHPYGTWNELQMHPPAIQNIANNISGSIVQNLLFPFKWMEEAKAPEAQTVTHLEWP